MPRPPARKPLALAALLATSAGAALAGMPSASATVGGVAPSPFTVDAGGQITVVGGATTPAPAGATDVVWSGNSSRIAYLVNGAVYASDPDGANPILVAPAAGARDHLTWDYSGQYVMWSEGGQIVWTLASGAYVGQPGVNVSYPVFGTADQASAGSADTWPDTASDGTIVFQRSTTATPAVNSVMAYTWDSTNRKYIVVPVVPADARQPTISPDGKSVAFVRSVTDPTTKLASDQIFTQAVPPVPVPPGWGTTVAPVQVTFADPKATAAVNHAQPTFSGDGKTIAFSVDGAAKGTYSVAATVAVGTTANPETLLANAVGTISVHSDYPSVVARFAGADRIDTAVQASRDNWLNVGATSSKGFQLRAKSVVLSRSDLFADALGGAALATHANGPLLLTDSNALNPEVAAEMKRILPSGSTVYLLGGTTALSPAVAAAIAAMGYQVTRIAGPDRYATSVAIADAVTTSPNQVLVATGDSFADALSAGAVAAAQPGTVVVLTAGTTAATGAVPASVESYLAAHASSGAGIAVAAIGGQANAALTRAGWSGFQAEVGADRFQTSYLVARDFFGDMSSVGVATGLNWADALSGGAYMGVQYGPLLLVDPAAGLSPQALSLIAASKGAISQAYVFGGTAALPTSIDAALANAIKSPAGVTEVVNPSSGLAAGVGKTVRVGGAGVAGAGVTRTSSGARPAAGQAHLG